MRNHQHLRLRSLGICTLLPLLLVLLPRTALSADPLAAATDAATRLVRFCIKPESGLDNRAVASLLDHVLSAKDTREYPLPKAQDCTGAYYEFETRIAFPRFLEYSYNPLIPAVITRPSSMRYSYWAPPGGAIQKLPGTWKPVPQGGDPVVVHSVQHESDTPDLHSSVYHEYVLRRTFILLNHKGRQALISVSKQIGTSDVGKKGVILGNDSDWNYYYSGEPGTAKAGLGWVKSYIYDYFSVGVYIESSPGSAMVRTGFFNWLRAGWSGVNFVRSTHILRGLQRFARDNRTVLESPRLPPPDQLIATRQGLSNLPGPELTKKYAALQQGKRLSAIRTGKIDEGEDGDKGSFADIPREQMVEELMLEYLKTKLGRGSFGIP